MFPKLSKSIYIDPFGANESAISKCRDATRQVLYENFICCICLYCGLMMSAFAHLGMPLNCASYPTGFHIMWCICLQSMLYVLVWIFTVFIDKT